MGKVGHLEKHEVDMAARAAHEVNRSWNNMIGSHLDPSWELLPEEAKQTARNAVIGIVVNDFNAEATHAGWLSEKKSQGWTLGDVKDVEKKTHPCLLSWANLPLEFQVKDELWVDTVRSFVKHLWKVPQ